MSQRHLDLGDGSVVLLPEEIGLVQRVLVGQRLVRNLDDPARLLRAGRAVWEAVATRGVDAVVAASRESESLVTAAILMSGSELHRAREDPTDNRFLGKICVVESVAISGARIRDSVRRLKDLGAEWIGVVILHDLSSGFSAPKHLASSSAENDLPFGPVDDLMVLG